MNFPTIYYHGYASQNVAGVALARFVARRLNDALFAGEADPVVVSDHVIFAGSGTAVLRHSYGIPGVIGEASFFTAYNRREAEAYALALEDFFSAPTTVELPSQGSPDSVCLTAFRAARKSSLS